MSYFTYEELKCPCCGKSLMNPAFMTKLNKLREHCGFPFKVSSAYRCEKHNKEVGGSSDSAHLKGRAVDIIVQGKQAFEVIGSAKQFGMTGIGVSQKGEHSKRFIHLDDTEGDLRPWVWSY